MRYLPGGCFLTTEFAHVAQTVERVLGKDVVMGSIPIVGSVQKVLAGGERGAIYTEEAR